MVYIIFATLVFGFVYYMFVGCMVLIGLIFAAGFGLLLLLIGIAALLGGIGGMAVILKLLFKSVDHLFKKVSVPERT
jgi:hypothetical protein